MNFQNLIDTNFIKDDNKKIENEFDFNLIFRKYNTFYYNVITNIL